MDQLPTFIVSHPRPHAALAIKHGTIHTRRVHYCSFHALICPYMNSTLFNPRIIMQFATKDQGPAASPAARAHVRILMIRFLNFEPAAGSACTCMTLYGRWRLGVWFCKSIRLQKNVCILSATLQIAGVRVCCGGRDEDCGSHKQKKGVGVLGGCVCVLGGGHNKKCF